MSNTAEIKYNKEQANYGIEQLKQCQKELYEADVLFYKGVMALAQAKGIDLILTEDAGINLYMPERIVIECREEITHLIEDITTKIALIEGFNDEPKEPVETIQRRELIEERATVQPMYAPPGEPLVAMPGKPGPQLLYAPPSVNPDDPLVAIPGKPGPQLLYAPPSVNPDDPLVAIPGKPGPQLLYAPPSVNPIGPIEGTPGIQPMYAPPGVEIGPIEGTPGPQLLYAPPSVNPIGPIEGTPIVQPMYAPPGIEERVSVPQMIYAPPSVTTPEYEPIPNTSTTGLIEKNYVSKHPKLIGGLGAAVGLFGIPTILSDDLDEEEERRYNQKKTY